MASAAHLVSINLLTCHLEACVAERVTTAASIIDVLVSTSEQTVHAMASTYPIRSTFAAISRKVNGLNRAFDIT
jgi:hypothetical protein